MDQLNERIEKYKIAVEFIKYYNDNLRRSISDFILAHTILFAFILTKSFDYPQEPHKMFFFISLFGFFLCVIWYGNCVRFRSHCDLRFAQARAAEPEGWNLIAGVGKDFSDGKKVEVGARNYQMDFIGRVIDKNDIKLLVWGFAMIYLLIMFKNAGSIF